MLKKVVVFIIVVTTIFVFVSCGKSSDNSSGSQTNEKYGFSVEKTVYDCEKFTLNCKMITSEGVEFECKNKSDEELKFHLTVALDGVVASFWSESSETEIPPKKTKTFYMHGSLDSIEHKRMSVDGTVFVDSGNISFDICDFELGGEENKDVLPSGDTVYSTEELVVDYVGADAQGVNFKVVNNREKSITFGADSFTINGNDKNYAMTVTTIPGHSQDIYSIDILSSNESYFSNELYSFEGVLRARIDGQGEVDRFRVSYENYPTQKIEQTSTVTRLGYAEAARLFEYEYEIFENIVSDFSDAIDYCNVNEFSSIEDIRKYESIWQDLANRATKVESSLLEKNPPQEYEKTWNNFAKCMGNIGKAFNKGINLDYNNDGSYTGNEIVALLSEIGDIFVVNASEAVDLTNELKAISETIDVSKNTNSPNDAKNTCTECGKNATRTYTNPFSGDVEYYCESHYQEIIDIMSMLEEDVGNSTQSKHSCEECSREGTHSLIGFSGYMEYYCTEHYEEIKDMLAMMGLN